MSCNNFSMFLVAEDTTVKSTKIARARCGSWDCDHCARINALVWQYRIKDTIESSESVWSFVTFTSPSKRYGKYVNTEISLEICQTGWKKFREALRYKNGGKFRYLRVYELQKNGRYHIHAILEYEFDDIRTARKGTDSEYTYSRWQKDNIKSWGFGFMCNAGNFNAGSSWSVGRYIAKYMTKGDPRIGDGVRRFQASHNFAKKSTESDGLDWTAQPDFTRADLYFALMRTERVYDVTTGQYVTESEVTFNQTYRDYISQNE